MKQSTPTGVDIRRGAIYDVGEATIREICCTSGVYDVKSDQDQTKCSILSNCASSCC